MNEVIIVGGGIVGLTAALALAKHGIAPLLIDAEEPVDSKQSSLRTYAINDASQALLQQLGVWKHLNIAQVSPYRNMHIWDAISGASIDFNAQMVGRPNLGCIIEESLLKEALLKEMGHSPITHLAAQKVQALQLQKNSIKITTNRAIWETQLLIGADGANSLCRTLLDVPLVSWPYHQKSIIAWVKTQAPHDQTAYQVFLPAGPLAFLPSSDPNYCSIVWSTASAHADHLMTLSEEKFNEALRTAFGDKLGPIALQSERKTFPLIMRHVKQYVGESWLLIGDAAHTIHPLAGLGLNVGLADINHLLYYLNAGLALNSKKTLGAYQRQRKHSVWQIILMLDALKFFFSGALPFLPQFRRHSLAICNGLLPLKQFLIHYAAGQDFNV